MRHPVLKPLTIASLILLAACVVLWHRGNRRAEYVYYSTSSSSSIAASSNGEIALGWKSESSHDHIAQYVGKEWWIIIALDQRGLHYGSAQAGQFEIFSFSQTIDHERGRFFVSHSHGTALVRIPFWFVVSALSLVPILSLTLWVRARRRATNGLCIHCRYDLRASKDRCPECGTEIPKDDSQPTAAQSVPAPGGIPGE